MRSSSVRVNGPREGPRVSSVDERAECPQNVYNGLGFLFEVYRGEPSHAPEETVASSVSTGEYYGSREHSRESRVL